MTILVGVPFNIVPNTLADANQVQGNFNAIVTEVNANTDLVALGFTGAVAITGTFVPLWFSTTFYGDRNSEIVAGPGGVNNGGFFKPLFTGTYSFSGAAQITSDPATTGIQGNQQQVGLFVNGVEKQQIGLYTWPYASGAANSGTFPLAGGQVLNALDQVSIRMQTIFTGTAPTIYFGALIIRRIA